MLPPDDTTCNEAILDFHWLSARLPPTSQSTLILPLFPSTDTKMAVIINTTALRVTSQAENVQMNRMCTRFYNEIKLAHPKRRSKKFPKNCATSWKWILHLHLVTIRSLTSALQSRLHTRRIAGPILMRLTDARSDERQPNTLNARSLNQKQLAKDDAVLVTYFELSHGQTWRY